MKIINDIAYSDDFEEILEALKVKPLPDHKLYVEFNNGEKRIFNFKPLLDFPAFQPLRDEKLFEAVEIEHGVVVWKQDAWEADISADYLQTNGVPVQEENIL